MRVPDQQIKDMDDDQAKELLADLRDAADIDAEPLTREEIASLERGLALAQPSTVNLWSDAAKTAPAGKTSPQSLVRRSLD